MSIRSYRTQVLEAIKQAKIRGLESAALIVEGETITNTPVISGQLKNSWEHEVDENTARVGSNVEYAPYVEYGTSRQTERRMLRDSINNNQDNIKSVIQSELNRI